jgi:hypothetical protein
MPVVDRTNHEGTLEEKVTRLGRLKVEYRAWQRKRAIELLYRMLCVLK